MITLQTIGGIVAVREKSIVRKWFKEGRYFCTTKEDNSHCKYEITPECYHSLCLENM